MSQGPEQYNPYDPSSPPQGPNTLPMDEIIRQAIISAFRIARVCVPCKVIKKTSNKRVDLQPLFQVLYVGQTKPSNMPVIQNVPVVMPYGSNYSIELPIAVGDTGYAIFSDRSLETWLASAGGIVDPLDSRSHDITDAIFNPGLVPFTNSDMSNSDALILKTKGSKVTINQNGTFKIENTKEGQELFDNLDKLMDTLINKTFTMTIFGPMPFIASTKQFLTVIRQNLAKLKG